ncbi:MAG: UvrD-helicase domain-containing protein [Chthoniobacterales bacterium]|nr:UvrD-helicase domain-containing protein [Chthoniobacterales bacterium]
MKPEDKTFQRNLLIVANAGSGKTHRLVTRCIQLLQRGAEPGEILALTFTRAAAAEFLQKLFERLAVAATDPRELEKLRKQLADCPPIDAAGCTKLLRRLVRALPRLSMGTLDQYFGRIVRAFPLELGLSREVELLDDADKEENQRRTLERLFSEAAAGEGLDEFIEMLRQQSRNRADQSALRAISRAVASLQEKFMETPANRPWGDPQVIWPEGCAILAADDVPSAADKFRAEVEKTNQLDSEAKAALGEWLESAAAHRPPRRMNKGLKDFVEKLTDDGLGKRKKAEEYIPIKGGRTDSKCLFLRGRVRELRDNLHRSILKLELESKLRSSRALYDLLQAYEEIYHHSVRRAGQLTFTDLVMLLADNQRSIAHKDIEYRLDGRYNHWLLDEFQDTSRLQWRIMEPLVDEVVCDANDRSFFYVGDTKQAIYGWRGGDFELFQQVHDNFKANRGVDIARRELPQSWRSDPNIIEVVNAVFAPARLENAVDFNFPAETVANWRKAWVDHEPLEGREKGFARFTMLEPDKDLGDDDGQMALDQAVLDIIRETNPVGRGINCAIIVRTREMLDHYVALLRGQEEPVPVAAEGRVNPCLKSPEGLALFALAKFLASPIDRIAEQQFLASPFGFLAGGDPAVFHGEALKLIAEAGVAVTFSGWVRETARRSLIDATKVESFIEAASDYEARRKPGEDLRALVEFVDHRVQQESETPGVVRVMTTHFSKGLGIDMVILPELGGKGMAELRDNSGITVHRDKEGIIRWGMSLPSKDICAADETLSAAREHLRARQAYENLCVLYVAMTRAKHALYCLKVRGNDSKNPGRWLEVNFPQGGGNDPDNRALGDARWFESCKLKQLKVPVIKGTPISRAARNSQIAATPSAHEGEDVPAGVLLGGGAARHLGTEVHELLAQVEWRGNQPDFAGATPEAMKLVREFLASERSAPLEKTEGEFLLWREKAFDVEIDGRPVGGIFDRVHIGLGDDGKPVCAQVYDFKTDRGPVDLAEKYKDQLATYAAAAALLLRLDLGKVEAKPVAIREAVPAGA